MANCHCRRPEHVLSLSYCYRPAHTHPYSYIHLIYCISHSSVIVFLMHISSSLLPTRLLGIFHLLYNLEQWLGFRTYRTKSARRKRRLVLRLLPRAAQASLQMPSDTRYVSADGSPAKVLHGKRRSINIVITRALVYVRMSYWS